MENKITYKGTDRAGNKVDPGTNCSAIFEKNKKVCAVKVGEFRQPGVISSQKCNYFIISLSAILFVCISYFLLT